MIIPYLEKDTTTLSKPVYNEVIVNLKLLMLKSYDQSISVHEYLNEKCRIEGTPEYRFIEEILDKDKLEANFEASMVYKGVEVQSKFYQTYYLLQVKESVFGDKEYKKPL